LERKTQDGKLRHIRIAENEHLVAEQGAFSSIPQSFLRQVHSLFQSEFSAERDVLLPLSISGILSFSYGNPLAVYIFFLIFPSFLSFLQ
jgi:hypothetical protein